jgi:hypothetical protein
MCVIVISGSLWEDIFGGAYMGWWGYYCAIAGMGVYWVGNFGSILLFYGGRCIY